MSQEGTKWDFDLHTHGSVCAVTWTSAQTKDVIQTSSRPTFLKRRADRKCAFQECLSEGMTKYLDSAGILAVFPASPVLDLSAVATQLPVCLCLGPSGPLPAPSRDQRGHWALSPCSSGIFVRDSKFQRPHKSPCSCAVQRPAFSKALEMIEGPACPSRRLGCTWSNSEIESPVWMGVSWCWGRSRARLVLEVFSRIASCVAFAWALFWKSELVPVRTLVQARVFSCREATPVNSRRTVQLK